MKEVRLIKVMQLDNQINNGTLPPSIYDDGKDLTMQGHMANQFGDVGIISANVQTWYNWSHEYKKAFLSRYYSKQYNAVTLFLGRHSIELTLKYIQLNFLENCESRKWTHNISKLWAPILLKLNATDANWTGEYGKSFVHWMNNFENNCESGTRYDLWRYPSSIDNAAVNMFTEQQIKVNAQVMAYNMRVALENLDNIILFLKNSSLAKKITNSR